jgi:hypothetical protein
MNLFKSVPRSFRPEKHDCIEIIDFNAVIDYDYVVLITPTP